jgi:hypothetical protein
MYRERMPVFWGIIHHCNTERSGAEREKMYRGTYANVLCRYPSLWQGTERGKMKCTRGALSIIVTRNGTERGKMYRERMPVFWGVIHHCNTVRSSAPLRFSLFTRDP